MLSSLLRRHGRQTRRSPVVLWQLALFRRRGDPVY
jgi:hypothetical protein